MKHDRFNNWLCTALLVVGIAANAAIMFMAITNTLVIKTALAEVAVRK